ncbi:MAG: hypothetical protein GX491_03445 [Chloroflexi bacterium]|nr:hypothetical protein [Chloroflexota bacterium]
MNELLPSVPGRILLLVSPSDALETLFDRVALLALQGPLYVLDGGNAFQGYALSRALHRRAAAAPEGASAAAAAAMQRVMLSRAFTCYQMATLLTEETFAPQPVLVLDFLATFYDQTVHQRERRRLLKICIRRLEAMSRAYPVAVWVRQRSSIPEDALSFLDLLKNAAGRVWTPRLPPRPVPQERQLSLFPLS